MTNYWPWIAFNLFVLAMLALDLGVFHRKAHVVKPREALIWSGVWIALALIFNLLLWQFWSVISPNSAYSNSEAALKFLTGYIIEKSLSVDNIFVILLLFTAFQIPAQYQHRVLFWGILGALVMRAGMIFAGVALIKSFHWMIYVFGAILVISAIKMVLSKDKKFDAEKNPVLKLFRRVMPVTSELHGESFFVRHAGKLMATPLFVVLLLVETTDLIFAVDSIPAILAISSDPFIVYTSNVFAILGLRSLYFALAGLVAAFHYLHYGLATVLAFVGVKMLLSDVYKVPTEISLGIIVSILAISVIASWLRPAKKTEDCEMAESKI